jgi:hypothetical protein
MKNFELRTTESTIHEPSSLICMLLLGGCWLALSASGQFSIDWFTIDGGGATSTSGVYSISGTIGQPDAGGAITGGNYSLTGGFGACSRSCPPRACLRSTSRVPGAR